MSCILLVEKDKFYIEILGIYFYTYQSSHNIIIVNSAEAAIEAADGCCPGFVFIDQDNIKDVKKLIERFDGWKVVLLTSEPETDFDVIVLEKPFRVGQIAKILGD
jgi:hypothetical protein